MKVLRLMNGLHCTIPEDFVVDLIDETAEKSRSCTVYEYSVHYIFDLLITNAELRGQSGKGRP